MLRYFAMLNYLKKSFALALIQNTLTIYLVQGIAYSVIYNYNRIMRLKSIFSINSRMILAVRKDEQMDFSFYCSMEATSKEHNTRKVCVPFY